MKLVILGFGGRGSLYAELFLGNKGVELAAVCDIKPEKLEIVKKKYGLKDNQLFLDEDEFFGKGKIADICVVSTQDEQHKDHAIKAMNKGYDLLLEKPIATTLADCEAIYNVAKKLNRKVFVCHVLRYAPFFNIIKQEIDSGKYGKISTINLTENVAAWHQAHSYVRGNWRNSDTSSPMIIAKCCHDLDILAWFIGLKCENVSSFGSLQFFKPENAPENSSERCFDCAYNDTCYFSAEKTYIKDRAEKGYLGWPCDILVSEPTIPKLYEAIKTGPYGRCVYKCDNNVVDHQVVNMLFEKGVTAHLTMTAFSKDCYREIHVHMTNGDIFGDMINNKLTCNIYGDEPKILDVNILSDTSYGHGGGDMLMVKDVVNSFDGLPMIGLTTIDKSMQSHFIGFAAEESRLNCGKVIKPLQ